MTLSYKLTNLNSRATVFALFFIYTLCTLNLGAAEWDSEIGAEVKVFLNDPARLEQDNENLSLSFKAEFYHDWDDDTQRFVITPFARWDNNDSERTHADLREFYWRKTFEDQNLDLKIGLAKVFWGVIESVHLVDIINQTDGVENLDGEDKLGQPMINLTLDKDWGTLDFFLLPYFRERTFPSLEGRPSLPVRVDTDNALFASGVEEEHIDVALRYSQVFGDWDVGIAHFSGTNREPYLIPFVDISGGFVVPFYDQIKQTSLDVQATLENWLWKLEVISRDSEQVSRYTALAGGFEYSFYDLSRSGIDLGLIGEYLFDDRKELSSSAFQNDVFIGGRFAFNDENSTDLLAGIVYDLDTSTRFLNLEGSRRIGQNMKISLEARFFSVDDPSDGLYSVRDDDYIGFDITRYF